MAVPSRPDTPVRHRLIRHGHRRACEKQIIAPIRRGTLMRHIIFSGPVTTRPDGMVEAPAAAGLVTPSGLALRQQPGFPRTAFETVHLATIAMAADQHLCAAPPAEKQPGRHAGLIGATASGIRRSGAVFWTHLLLSAIFISHCAPARCRARR
ncbi:hypothetical protein [Ferrovum sp.]|uniref:hypothetical protein n=1 Tax=Ferrovum sp. TaxID=2609467 RepID=UPI0026125142|nr:hypothetical protein [Ferrovum sp.]